MIHVGALYSHCVYSRCYVNDVFVGDISPQRATADGHLSKGIRRDMELRCKTLDSYPSNKIRKQKQTNKLWGWEERDQWLRIIISEIIFRNSHLKKVKLMPPLEDLLITCKTSPQIRKGDSGLCDTFPKLTWTCCLIHTSKSRHVGL